jgi:hypothetical protein
MGIIALPPPLFNRRNDRLLLLAYYPPNSFNAVAIPMPR